MHVCTYEKCGKETRSLIKGLCSTCYARYQRNGTAEHVRAPGNIGVRACSFCENAEGPFIKSLCRACYQRQYHHGTPEPQRTRRLCEAPGCDDPAVSHGLCNRHRQRLRRHGTAQAGRPEGWGAKVVHPMYEAWQGMRRTARNKSGYDPRWSDFWIFLEDVGERPFPNSRLYRIDSGRPFSKENCEWRASVLDPEIRASKAEYQRAYRVKRPHVSRKASRKRLYGIADDWFERTLAAQNGACAICRLPEAVIDPRSGETFALAVDHCHVTSKRRGLLCMGCNTGIGGLKHDRALIQAADAYLAAHEVDVGGEQAA